METTIVKINKDARISRTQKLNILLTCLPILGKHETKGVKGCIRTIEEAYNFVIKNGTEKIKGIRQSYTGKGKNSAVWTIYLTAK